MGARRRSTSGWRAVGALVAAASCTSEAPSEVIAIGRALERSDEVVSPCPLPQGIARGTCETVNVNGWKPEPLVVEGRPFCRYEWAAAAGRGGPSIPDAGRVDQLGAQVPGLEWDCPWLTASSVPADIWSPLRDNMHRQAGRVAAASVLSHRVRVAVVDSAARPYQSDDHDNNGHARAIGRVIADLVCGSAPCGTTMHNYLALPYISATEVDLVGGGFMGTRLDLAAAINRALDEWVAGPPGERLIINLSVGWEEGHPDQSETPTLLVRKALERASCLGAVVLAAAGNLTGPASRGALLPARWEADPAPSPAECAGRSMAARGPARDGGPVRDGGYAPLLFAVGGVDEGDRPLRTTRPGSVPRLVAHGMAVVTDDSRPGGRTAILSGTSMATAVVSGVAAAIWSRSPGLSSAALIDFVYRSAVPLAGTANDLEAPGVELCLGDCGGLVRRRVELCGALTALGTGTPANCTTVPAHGGQSPAVTLRRDGACVPSSAGGCRNVDRLPGELGVRVEADPMPPEKAPPPPPPWVAGQPGGVGCETCIYDPPPSGLLSVRVPPHLTTQIQSITLETFSGNGALSHKLYPDAAVPETFWTPIAAPADSALITFVLRSGRVLRDPVITLVHAVPGAGVEPASRLRDNGF